MNSIWTKTVKRPIFPTQNGDIKTDVLIIGGGIAGILCAYKLKKAGIECTLIEANKICSGITQNTTAKITLQHGLIYDKMIKRFGLDFAKKYIKVQENAINQYKTLSQNIDCGFKESNAFVYSKNNREIIENEVKAYEKMGYTATLEEKTELPFEVSAAVKISRQAQFHPLKFLYSISSDLPIFENTKAINFAPGCITTNRGKIYPQKTIVATHFPIINKHGFYFAKMYQHRSYVIAFKNAQMLKGMYVDEDKTGLSFRTYDDVLLVGGGGHKTGKSGGNWQEIAENVNKYYQNAIEIVRWAAQDCITLDDIPYIGKYSDKTGELFVTTGFNKWGMTSSMVAADILSDLIQDLKNENSDLFSPARSILRPRLFSNLCNSAFNLLTPTAPRCPHLGCALKYNRVEHSWDCPCHGSRFDENGALIDGPATDDKK